MSLQTGIKKRFIQETFHFFLINELKNLDVTRTPVCTVEQSIINQVWHILATGVEIARKGLFDDSDLDKARHFLSQTLHRTVGDVKSMKHLKFETVS